MALRIGHRGAKGYEPENTLLSFKKAMGLNVDMIELDVQLCKSGELVIVHDETSDRTTNSTGKISEMDLREIKLLDAGKGERIPTLEEALSLIDRKVSINVELKGKNTGRPTARLIEKFINEKGWPYDNFLISSSDQKELKEFHKIIDKVKLGLIVNRIPFGYIRRAQKLKAYSINLRFLFATKRSIEKAHRLGFKVFAWTVNEKKDIQRMISLGVDGIISDYPDRVE